jgi:Fe-S cluster biogenesis protein NfuA/nitrite reductase/ring-hydroxylating ferredoxin subunit
MADDGLVGSLLLIHDLYPVPIEERVQEALDEVRPYMESHGGNVELLAVEEGVAKLRLTGSCDGCAASSSTLELAVEKALEEKAPDLLGMEVEGAVPSSVTGTALPMAGNGHPSGMGDWIPMDGLDGMAPGELRAVEASGKRLLVASVDGDLLAYLDSCADCGGSLAGAELVEGVLACPSCTRRYYLPRAGRSLDDDRLQLGPVPLLADAEGPRVALPA